MIWMRNNRVLVAMMAVSACLFAVMSLWTLPAIQAAADGLAPFDKRFQGYSPAEAQLFLEELSVQGRWLYVWPQRILDGLFPALFAMTLVGLAIAALAPGRWRNSLIAIIAAGMMADYLENIRVAMLLGGGFDSDLVMAASRMTQAKFVFDLMAICGVCLALISLWMRKRKVR